MKHPESVSRSSLVAGFTLPAILVVVGALLILAVGILIVAGIERSTARSFVDRQRAELAARTALEDIRAVFNTEAVKDDYLVIQSFLNQNVRQAEPGTTPREKAPFLFLTRAKASNVGLEYTHIPLFSSAASEVKAAKAPSLLAPPVEDFLSATEAGRKDFEALPYLDQVRADWMPVKDDKGRIVARYAYWLEDLQGRIDPKIAGNMKSPIGTHARSNWPFPAAGLNDQPKSKDQPALDQIALFAADPAARQSKQGEIGQKLISHRSTMLSPGSSLAAAGFNPPLERLKADDPVTGGKAGELIDEKARVVEKCLIPGLRSYLEQPLIPPSMGIAQASVGEPKRNLNQLLSRKGSNAVAEMSDFIRKALPQFEGRKGGFPDDYLKTLAANAFDYADTDGDTTAGSDYRGIDSYPLVSEFLLKSRWDNVRVVRGRKLIELSVSIYVEIWNMTNKPVQGDAEFSYETKYRFSIPPNPNSISLGDLSKATHNLVFKDGYHWFPVIRGITLAPNEYRVINCGTVRYSFDAVSENEFVSSPITLSGELNGTSGAGYRMKWNGLLVDQSRGAVHRNDSSINFPADTKASPRQRFRTTVPSHSHRRSSFVNNMGDPRMSFYNLSSQDANIYPQNFSPNRRNIRQGTIYSGSNLSVYGRVLPSEWPDGGHDSPFGVDSVAALVGMSQAQFDNDHRIEPDNPGFFGSLPSLSRGDMEAPTRLSNGGRFFSVTELGHVYDPVMWQVRDASDTSNTPGRAWGDVLSSSQATGDYGGGNTLRIGRPEHPGFDNPGQRASRLLDLFHVGRSRSTEVLEREGPLIEIEGHVNINTAPKDVIRMLIAGELNQDPQIRRFKSEAHDGGVKKYPAYDQVSPPPDGSIVAGRIADAVVRSRPFSSPSELLQSREADGTQVFGNPKLFPGFEGDGFPIMQWTDSAAEEMFARAYEASTVRSRNFRVWIVGQALTPSAPGNSSPEVIAEVRKAFTVFADPGKRNEDGSINPANSKLTIIDESDF